MEMTEVAAKAETKAAEMKADPKALMMVEAAVSMVRCWEQTMAGC